MSKMKKTKLFISMLLSISSSMVMATSDGLVALEDDELSNTQGQALLSLGYVGPSASGTGANYSDYGYYKLGMEAEIELNANIRRLQLGCGGVNGPDNCDIDIENLSLSGPADSKIDHTTAIAALKAITNRTATQEEQLQALIAEHGTPIWSEGRANTSTKLTNPFIEFAIKNPTSAATREVVGFRLSAEEILGHMSAGVTNDKNPTTEKSTGGGINMYSGYIKVAPTPVSAFTEPAMFGTTEDQILYANVRVIGLWERTAFTNPNAMTPGKPGYRDPESDSGLRDNAYKYNGTAIWGIHVPSQTVDFIFPRTAVTGNRMSQLNLVVRDVPIPTIPIAADNGAVYMTLDAGINALFTTIHAATFFMGTSGTTASTCISSTGVENSGCSYIKDLKVNVTVKENFNLVHNLPIISGGYLSLQKVALRWPGSASAFTYDTRTTTPEASKYVDRADNYVTSGNLKDWEVWNEGDIAQPGWWLSFQDPLDFGALNPTSGIGMADVLPQISTFVTDTLSQPGNEITLNSIGEIVSSLVGAPLYKSIGDIRLASDARAVMVLQNLQLDGHQNPVSNCWGNLKFC